MSWTFNPPPGWPAHPEGWQPPPGWAPDPSWPPAPPDWKFWVPARASAPAPSAVLEAPTAVATLPVSPYQPGSPGTPYPAGGYPPAADRPWHRRWWAAGVAALAVLLAGCLAGTVVALLTD